MKFIFVFVIVRSSFDLILLILLDFLVPLKLPKIQIQVRRAKEKCQAYGMVCANRIKSQKWNGVESNEEKKKKKFIAFFSIR